MERSFLNRNESKIEIGEKLRSEWAGVLSENDVWIYSYVTASIVLLASLSGFIFGPCLASKSYVFATNIIISLGMSSMVAAVFFQLMEPSYHNFVAGPPPPPDCSDPWDEDGFLIIAIMGYSAFGLFFNVDKIMTLILTNPDDESDDVAEPVTHELRGENNEAYVETDFGNEEEPTRAKMVNGKVINDDENRLRTGTNVSLGGRSRAGTGGLRTAAMMTAADVGNANIATEARGRDRTLSDLDTIKKIMEKSEKNTEKKEEEKEVEIIAGPNYVAIISIIGSIIESFVYGIAIGAGYQRNVGFGIAMGFALLTEAIPHKITDYLLLLNTGMSRQKAALANFGTALFMYAGVGISGGLFYGVYDNNWIFGIVLGIFIYAGMGVLLPELDHSIENSMNLGFNKWSCLALQNVGIIAGLFVICPLRIYGPCWLTEA